MQSFRHRPEAPQPKTLYIEPPTYTVPDVTLMIDSDDSIIWKPGNYRSKHPNNSNLKSSDTQENINLAVTNKSNEKVKDNDKENYSSTPSLEADYRSEGSEACTYTDNTVCQKIMAPLSTKHINTPSSRKMPYNPDVYSPKPVRPFGVSTHNLKTNFHTNKAKDCYKQPIVTTVIPDFYEVINNIKDSESLRSSFEEKIPSVNKSSHEFQNVQRDLKYHNQAESSDINSTENKTINNDPYIYKIIESQNQQILYLHKVLEKLLKSNDNNKEKCTVCAHSKKETKLSQKVAMTQTDFDGCKTETKSVATNTDISWEALLTSVRNVDSGKCESLLKEPSLSVSYKCEPICNKENREPLCKCTYKNFPSENVKRDESFTLKDVVVDTVYDPPSPEPSLHINLPEYNGMWHQHHLHENVKNKGDDDDSPLMGESAIIYNERLRQNDGYHFPDQESSLDEKNGVTFYNKVMINVQQVLHRYGKDNTETDDAVPVYKEMDKDMHPTCIRTKKDAMVNKCSPTSLQLQKFGISFLDPITLADRRKPHPALDTFCMPRHALYGYPPSNLEIVDGCRRERQPVIASQYVNDAYLASIAQKSPEDVRNPVHPRYFTAKREQLPMKGESCEEFSFATKQFLEKYVG